MAETGAVGIDAGSRPEPRPEPRPEGHTAVRPPETGIEMNDITRLGPVRAPTPPPPPPPTTTTTTTATAASAEAVVPEAVGTEVTVVPARSAEAFAELYHAQYAPMVRVAYLILESREQAEEIVQDAFVRVHGRWAKTDNPPAYLRATVVNGCRDTIRRRVRYRRRERVLVGPTSALDAPDELSDALATLTTRQRAVLVLKFYGGLPEAEIAEILDIKVGTVKSSISRGIERLRQELPHDQI